ncbi:hypothetical protein Agabi119p4_7728 [Agaricus bisporus var. burnettii]|uniref:Integrase catalytic domain-containing protein n=1 Tax=Agaricus bisporus var. burnettii TaxID=192524 RepID=A0A8H7EZS7_AGABI|nr:hypothetical protein Agabi119p4_7728 [Agaricus bisporus var. burnettii]
MASQSRTHAPYAWDTTSTRFGVSPTRLRASISTTTPSGSHTPSPHFLGPISGPKNVSIACSFCGRVGHMSRRCRKRKNAKKRAQERSRLPGTSKSNVKGPLGHLSGIGAALPAVKTLPTPPGDVSTGSGSPGSDIPLRASALGAYSSPSSSASSSSPPSSPLQLDADFFWLADTGATSHMTPHRHWFKSYSPHRIPIRLADNSTVYSAGVGSVVFQPVVNGKETRAVEFTRVLHVPDLKSNLLSCLYLAQHKGFNITISAHSIDFKYQGRTLFTATIHSNNSAELDSSTVTSETAFSVSTLPVDLSLWHRRFIHHNYADVKSMISKDLVSGLKLESNSSPDSICEPCLAGKMHSLPFPSSLNHNHSPLELVHSDLHGPLPVASHSGYKYWITFIDDATRFRAVYLLKAKSEAFEAFKVYNSWAETQLGVKLRALQDDKGGEYMSKAFISFTELAGIERRHSTRNRPQQNGLAERANRTMGERITAMLSESRLPGCFWGECISSMVHVWNMLPTASLSGTTPFQAFYKRKPDVSHLRVWGCTAYVHVQRDKRNSLQPHYEKCVFIGYPAGYKGWKFYNPVTKQTVISERADFDERYFLGTSKAQLDAVPSFACLPEPLQTPNDTSSHSGLPPLQDEGGDNHFPPARPKTPTPSASVPPEEKPVLPLPLPVIPPFIPPVIPPVTPPQIHAPLPVTPPTAGAPLEPPHVPRRTGRVRKPPGQWWKLKQPDLAGNDSDSEDEAALLADSEFCEVEFAGAVSGADPGSYRLAMKSPDSDCWTEACNTEIFNLEANGTWELIFFFFFCNQVAVRAFYSSDISTCKHYVQHAENMVAMTRYQ